MICRKKPPFPGLGVEIPIDERLFSSHNGSILHLLYKSPIDLQRDFWYAAMITPSRTGSGSNATSAGKHFLEEKSERLFPNGFLLSALLTHIFAPPYDHPDGSVYLVFVVIVTAVVRIRAQRARVPAIDFQARRAVEEPVQWQISSSIIRLCRFGFGSRILVFLLIIVDPKSPNCQQAIRPVTELFFLSLLSVI
nr:hypothetical protein Iba_chr09eCG6670 [Ipomoea batatas]